MAQSTLFSRNPSTWIAVGYALISYVWLGTMTASVVNQGIVEQDDALRYLGWSVGFVTIIALTIHFALLRWINRFLAMQRALRRTSRQMEALASLSSAGIIDLDTQGQCAFANRRFQEISGLTLEECVGDGYRRALHPEDLERLAGGNPPQPRPDAAQTEFRMRRPDGRTVWVASLSAPEFDEDGNWTGQLISIIDINERKQAEEALKENEELYRTVFESSQVAVALTDLEGKVVAYNQAMLELGGYTAEEVETILRASHFYHDPADREQVVKTLRENGAINRYELRLRRKDGAAIEGLLSARIVTVKGKPHIHSIIQDVTSEKRAIEALRESEERFRRIFEDGPMGMAIGDMQGRFVRVNRAECDMLGYTEAELIGKTFADITHPDDLAEDLRQSKRLYSGEISHFEMEKRLLRMDGKPLWVHLTAFMIRDQHGNSRHGLGIIKDISSRKEAVEALRQSEERFRRIFKEGPLGMIIESPERQVITVNRAVCDLLGYEEGEMLGRTAKDFVHPDDLEETNQLVLGLYEGAASHIKRELRMIRKDGGIIWAHMTSFLLRDSEGWPLCGLSLINDITEKRQAEAALRESEERFRRLADNAPDVIFRGLVGRGLEYVSPAVEPMTGYTVQEFCDDPDLPSRVILPDDLPAYEQAYAAMLTASKAPEPWIGRVARKDGRIATVELRVALVRDEHGRAIAVEGIARDVTQQQVDRQRLRELGQRLAAAQEEERRRVATELHDEVGQLLTVARMRLDMITNQLPKRAKAICEQAAGLSQLLADILATVRGLSQELSPPLLNELGWQPALEWLCESLAKRSGVEVSYKHSGDKDRLPAPVELAAYRVAQEALTNALRHSHASDIQVTSRFAKHGVRITIRDNGRGFDIDSLSRAHQPGVGLGLLLMRERCATVEGRLRIASQPGSGTAVIAQFPATNGEKA